MIQTYLGPNLSEDGPSFYPFKIQFIHYIGSHRQITKYSCNPLTSLCKYKSSIFTRD